MAKGKQPNMKVNVTADNSNLSRKMKESAGAVKDFEKVSNDALSSFGSAIGVNVDQVSRLSNSLKGLGEKMQKSGNEGAKSMGKIVSAIGGATAAIAGLGIGAAVASFKLLNDEATAFKNTVQGASIDLQTTAFVSTYAQALRDANEQIGQSTAEQMAEVTKKWKTLWTEAKFIAVNAISDIFTGEAMPGGAGNVFVKPLAELNILRGNAMQLADEASRIEQRMYDIRLKMIGKTIEWARMERDIAEYKRIAYDKTVDTATQQQALNKATDLIKSRYKEEAQLKKQLADLQEQYNSLVSSSLDDIQKASQLRVDEENTVTRMNNALRELSERQSTVAANAAKEAQARQEALEYAKATAASREALKDWRREAGLDKTVVPEVEIPSVEVKVPDISIPPVTVTVDGSISEIGATSEILQKALESSSISMGVMDDSADSMTSIFEVAAAIVGHIGDEIAMISDASSAIADNASREAQARQRSADALKIQQSASAIAATGAVASVQPSYTGPANIYDLLPKGAEALAETGIAIPITPELDMSGVVDITNELQSVMTSAFDMIGVSIGELIGDLATGGDAWSNFANTAIGAFGDMAISIGKMAISTGVATLGIKKALQSLNPYVAIAAGTALVALGAAVKAGLSNIASGSYSSSANVATAGGYGSTSMLGSDFETREMKVEVTGTLRASGNELLTVIENENNRKKHTT